MVVRMVAMKADLMVDYWVGCLVDMKVEMMVSTLVVWRAGL